MREEIFVFACSEKISSVDVNVGEAKAALLAASLASSFENNPLYSLRRFIDRHLGNKKNPLSCLRENPLQLSRISLLQANLRAHPPAKWAAAHCFFYFFWVLSPVIALFFQCVFIFFPYPFPVYCSVKSRSIIGVFFRFQFSIVIYSNLNRSFKKIKAFL